MKRFSVCLFLLILLIGKAFEGNAQLLTGAEYFINTDPGVGNGTPINVTGLNILTVSIAIPATSLPRGFNQLFIRTKDQNNNWSIAEQRTFYIDSTLHTPLPALSSAEYFFDTDPGVGNAKALSIQSVDTLTSLFNISTAGLVSGYHQLFIRTKDQTGSWSIGEQRTFLKDSNISPVPSPLIAAEYYIDVDSGVGKNEAIAITKADTVNSTYSYTATNLPLGNHTMNLRVEDSTGKWSVVQSRPFIVCTTYGPLSYFTFAIADSTVTFTNTSQYGTGYHWIFGDGDTSNAANPVHVYKAGTYKACLVSKNDCLPAGDTMCNSVVVTNSVLPLTLLNFQATLSNNIVNCTWQTANETNTDYFIVQRSKDDVIFSNINKVYAAGNSSITRSYNFIDESPNNGSNYYRLQMVDKGGKFTYSKTIPINVSLQTLFVMYPNPVKDNLFIQIHRNKDEEVTLQIMDMQGKVVKQKTVQMGIGVTTLFMSTNSLSKGSYFAVIKGKITQKKMFVKE